MKIKQYRADVLVIGLLLLVALTTLALTTLGRTVGNTAVVEINGQVAARYPLDKDGVFPLNGGTNVLVIENGTAFLSYSDCPDHTCERTGKIRYAGQTIVCLPNRLSITVRGEMGNQGVDLIS